MKTGKDVIERALQLLGYTNNQGELDWVRDAALFKRGAIAVLQIYDDLKRFDSNGDETVSLSNMIEEIQLSRVTIDDIMPYGVAMLLAQNEGDSDSHALFAKLYSRKRTSVPKEPKIRPDVLPGGGY